MKQPTMWHYVAVIGLWLAGFGAVALAVVTVLDWRGQDEPAPPDDPLAAYSVPLIEVKRHPDPNNQARNFVQCARGDSGACVQSGAWLIGQARAGRGLSICLHATGAEDDIEQCTGLEARWPE